MHAHGRVCAYVLELFGNSFGRSRGTRGTTRRSMRRHSVRRYPWATLPTRSRCCTSSCLREATAHSPNESNKHRRSNIELTPNHRARTLPRLVSSARSSHIGHPPSKCTAPTPAAIHGRRAVRHAVRHASRCADVPWCTLCAAWPGAGQRIAYTRLRRSPASSGRATARASSRRRRPTLADSTARGCTP